ncbi:hypothetical protein [Hymenobacter sp.]|jgi:hypothetical protein|uniref:hypothetical protein n=1 Tax=Hymenobacter sp. TaxID=1898978 RepID=UPI002ED9FF2C
MENWAGALHLASRALEAAPLLPFALLWARRYNIPFKFKLLPYYIGAELVLYVLKIVSRFIFRNDVYTFHLSTALAVLLLAETYRRLFHSHRILNLISVSVWIFIGVAFLDAAVLNGIFKDLNSYARAFGSIILITLSLLHIVQISRTSLSLEEQPEFFLDIAVLTYFSYSIVTYVATNIIYNSGYDLATRIKLDRIISSPDIFLFAIQMGLFAWLFNFIPLHIAPLRALPYWLHYSRWHPRPYRLLGQSVVFQNHLTTTAGN